MVIFHSYVSLPEGSMSIVDRFLWCFHGWIRFRGSQSGGLFGATVP